MEDGVDDLKKMNSRQLLDLRQTLAKARDGKLNPRKGPRWEAGPAKTG
jgi:hypothetical protein